MPTDAHRIPKDQSTTDKLTKSIAEIMKRPICCDENISSSVRKWRAALWPIIVIYTANWRCQKCVLSVRCQPIRFGVIRNEFPFRRILLHAHPRLDDVG